MGIITNYYREKDLQDKNDQELIDQSADCELWKTSNCCGVPFWNDTDVCSDCLEHADTACQDCELASICINDNQFNSPK